MLTRLQEALMPKFKKLLADTHLGIVDHPCDLEGEHPITRRSAEPEHV